MTGQDPKGLEEQRVFAAVARSMLGEPTSGPKVGRFELRERLGAGAMGEVFSGYDPDEARDVAIKVLASDRQSDAEAIARIKREARALSRMQHPNVVRIVEVGEDDGRVYIAMERLQGESLDDAIARRGPLPVSETLAVIRGVCDALAHAHGQSIVHRDLKPANVFLCETDGASVAKVLDFGVAKGLSTATLGGSTASGTVLGTPYYMSPEQARDSSKVDARADLWAVAIIAYECLLGHRPFDASNLPDLAVQILTQAPPTPSEHGPVPPGFDAWFARATHRDPEERFSSASELAAALQTALAERPHPAPARSWERAAWIVAAAALVAGLGWLLVRPDTPASRMPPTDDTPPASSAPAPVFDAPPNRQSEADPHAAPEPSDEAEPPPVRKPPPRKAAPPPTPSKSDALDDLEF